MQLTRTLLLLCLLVAALSATAQKKNALTDHKNVVKINFNTDIVEGGIPLGWEIRTAPRQSLQLAVTFTYSKNDDAKTSGIGFNPEYRFYLSKNKPGISGVYAGPFASVNFLTYKDRYYNGSANTDISYKSTIYGGGLVFGHQWAWQSGFALDLNIGLGFKSVDYSNRPAYQSYYYDDFAEGFVPRLGFAIGYAF
jgi:hypothetical protein